MATNFDELYEKYNILSDAKNKVGEHSSLYLECIESTKGDNREKKLAAKIIQTFFKHFPDIQDAALNAIMDLCEDEDRSIRISAINVLPFICKDSKGHCEKVADILVQLLQLDDQDYVAATKGLEQVFKVDALATIRAACNHVQKCNEYAVREKVTHVIFKKLLKITEKVTNDVTELVIKEAKKTIQDSTQTEFVDIVSYLSQSKLTKTNAGQQELVDLIAERAEIDRDFDVYEEGGIDRILLCVQYALPLFNSNVESTKFLVYYTDQILPQFGAIGAMKEGELLQLQILHQLAELSGHCGALETASVHVVQIFDKMKDYMPPPPEDGAMTNLPNLEFSAVECLLYAFHRLARQCPDFLTADPQVLKDFRVRLTYFSRGVQGCKRSLEATISKSGLQKEVEQKIKIAPTLLNNINTLIKDLFYQPPVYKCHVTLSFKKEEDKRVQVSDVKSAAQQKRHAPITFDLKNGGAAKHVRPLGEEGAKGLLYQPPNGKFSNNFQKYERPSGRGRGRGGRGGRGASRPWRN